MFRLNKKQQPGHPTQPNKRTEIFTAFKGVRNPIIKSINNAGGFQGQNNKIELTVGMGSESNSQTYNYTIILHFEFNNNSRPKTVYYYITLIFPDKSSIQAKYDTNSKKITLHYDNIACTTTRQRVAALTSLEISIDHQGKCTYATTNKTSNDLATIFGMRATQANQSQAALLPDNIEELITSYISLMLQLGGAIEKGLDAQSKYN